jgi:putative RecB family exonuclease
MAVWAAVEKACEREDFRPKPGRLCSYCAFRAYCPAVGGDLSLLPAPPADGSAAPRRGGAVWPIAETPTPALTEALVGEPRVHTR